MRPGKKNPAADWTRAGRVDYGELKRRCRACGPAHNRMIEMAALESIIASLPSLREGASAVREILLANLAMIGEIPAPTFGEEERMQFLAGRFAEMGLQNGSLDDRGNAIGVVPGSEGGRSILLVAHADTIVENDRDQTIEIQTDRVIGPFVGDNCIAAAALATLPALLDRLNLRLKSDLVLLAAARTLGRGNLEGVRHFLANSGIAFSAGVCLESVQLGRLNYTCLGMLRGEITCRLADTFNWSHYGASGTIVPMSDIVNRISRIPLPTRPFTRIIIGMIEGGISYNNIARETRLRFEILSESTDIIQSIRRKVEDITEDVAGHSGTRVSLDIFAQREPGGIDIGHPLVRNARAIMNALGLQPEMYSTTSLLSALRDAGIPAVTLGLTTGERKNELDEIDESAAIEPIATGLAQLVGVVMSADEGWPT